MSEPRCETCRYWSTYPGMRELGACRRYPPAQVDGKSGVIPAQSSLSWCGEWVQREPDPWEREP